MQASLFVFLLGLTTALTQESYPRAVTCYTTYVDSEQRATETGAVLNFVSTKVQATLHYDAERQLCEDVGCACFSYQAHCGRSLSETKDNHYSECSDADRASHAIGWYRGGGSRAECERMRQKPRAYMNLTCCTEPLCNNQPGKTITYIQTRGSMGSSSTASPQHHEAHSHRSTRPRPQVFNEVRTGATDGTSENNAAPLNFSALFVLIFSLFLRFI